MGTCDQQENKKLILKVCRTKLFMSGLRPNPIETELQQDDCTVCCGHKIVPNTQQKQV